MLCCLFLMLSQSDVSDLSDLSDVSDVSDVSDQTRQTESQRKADLARMSKRLERGLPQTVPFQFYAQSVYSFGRMDSENEGPEPKVKDENDPWWEAEIDGHSVGAPKKPGHVSLPDAVRAAWGMRWWGERLKQKEWVEHADQLLNLALAAPIMGGGRPADCTVNPLKWPERTGFDSRLAFWYLRWLEKWPNDERKDEVLKRFGEAIAFFEKEQDKMDALPQTFIAPGPARTLGPDTVRFLDRLVRYGRAGRALHKRAYELLVRQKGSFGMDGTTGYPDSVLLARLEAELGGRIQIRNLKTWMEVRRPSKRLLTKTTPRTMMSLADSKIGGIRPCRKYPLQCCEPAHSHTEQISSNAGSRG